MSVLKTNKKAIKSCRKLLHETLDLNVFKNKFRWQKTRENIICDNYISKI